MNIGQLNAFDSITLSWLCVCVLTICFNRTGLHELQGIMIRVEDCLFSKDVMLPLEACLDNGVCLPIIGGVLVDCIQKSHYDMPRAGHAE